MKVGEKCVNVQKKIERKEVKKALNRLKASVVDGIIAKLKKYGGKTFCIIIFPFFNVPFLVLLLSSSIGYIVLRYLKKKSYLLSLLIKEIYTADSTIPEFINL